MGGRSWEGCAAVRLRHPQHAAARAARSLHRRGAAKRRFRARAGRVAVTVGRTRPHAPVACPETAHTGTAYPTNTRRCCRLEVSRRPLRRQQSWCVASSPCPCHGDVARPPHACWPCPHRNDPLLALPPDPPPSSPSPLKRFGGRARAQPRCTVRPTVAVAPPPPSVAPRATRRLAAAPAPERLRGVVTWRS